MGARVFGAGHLWTLRNDITGQTPIKIATLQETSVDFKGALKGLYGSGKVAEALANGQLKVTGKVKNAVFDGRMLNDVFFGDLLATGYAAVATLEAATVGATTTANTSADCPINTAVLTFAAAPGVQVGVSVAHAGIPAGAYVLSVAGSTVTLSTNVTADVPSGSVITFGPSCVVANAATFVKVLSVAYAASGYRLTLATGAPAAGQFTANAAGGFAFNTADVGAGLLISYGYSVAASGESIELNDSDQGISPVVGMTLLGKYNGPQGIEVVTLTLYATIFEGFTIGTKQADWSMNDLSFEAMKNAAGSIGNINFNKPD
jgi:hypothetical protein